MKKKIILTIILCSFLFCSCGDKIIYESDELTTNTENTNYFKSNKEQYNIALITDYNGLNDKSINDLGLKGLERAYKDLNISKSLIETNSIEKYRESILEAINSNMDLIIPIGKSYENIINEMAKKYDNQKFLVIDYEVNLSNVKMVYFREEETMFLFGITAAVKTKNNEILYLDKEGINSDKLYYSFLTGVKEINKDINVERLKIDDKISKDDFQSLLNNEMRKKYDVVVDYFSLFLESLEYISTKNDIYIMYGDSDLYNMSNWLCKSNKLFDEIIYNTSKELINESFEGGYKTVGLKDKGMNFIYNSKALSDIKRKKIDKYIDFIDGKYFTFIPTNEDEFIEFKIPRNFYLE